MLRRMMILSLLLGAMAACASGPIGRTSDPRPEMDRSYNLTGLTFTAAEDITVSEANNYYPAADIVWRGDPLGNRVEQIGTLFQEAARRNIGNMGGTQPVTVDIELLRFHGVTQRTQYSVGGVHNIIFMMTVRDARTGAVIEQPRRIVANLEQPGGQEALRLEQSGQTQRVRVVDFLASVLRSELI